MSGMKKTLFCLLAAGLITCVSVHAAGIQEYYEGRDALDINTLSIDTLKADTTNTADEGFLDNTEIQWLLTSVSINGSDTGFNRGELNEIPNEAEFFTLMFGRVSFGSSGNVSGVGAPNRFSAPYTYGNNRTIEILPMRSTLMASIFEPQGLKEYDYYNYLQNAYKWDHIGNRLEIYSKTGNQEVVMIFVREE